MKLTKFYVTDVIVAIYLNNAHILIVNKVAPYLLNIIECTSFSITHKIPVVFVFKKIHSAASH